MNPRTRLIVMVAAIALAVAILAVTLVRCGQQPAPGTETPGAETTVTTASTNVTEKPATPAATAGPTRTPTEGEKAAEAVGQEYIAYRPREAECDELVDGGRSESCVWPKDIWPITRPEWEQLLSDTTFYLIGMAGRNQEPMYDHGYYLELAAWYEGTYHGAEAFDRLLAANGITAITDENCELVAQAFALMTIPDYLGEEIVFTEWESIQGEPGKYKHDYDHCLRAWTKLQGLEVGWCFVFGEGRLKIATGPVGIQHDIGDYVEVNPDQLSLPAQKDYRFTGE
jgi:hypothetical protein